MFGDAAIGSLVLGVNEPPAQTSQTHAHEPCQAFDRRIHGARAGGLLRRDPDNPRATGSDALGDQREPKSAGTAMPLPMTLQPRVVASLTRPAGKG
jgi:hypothetical protein